VPGPEGGCLSPRASPSRARPAKNPGYLPRRPHPVTGAGPNPLTRALPEERDSGR